jgi:flagellum-specific ATP synthase
MSAHAYAARLQAADLAPPYGYVRKVAPGVVEATGPAQALGELCEIVGDGGARVLAEITAVDERGIVLIPLEPHATIHLDAKVLARATRDRVPVGDAFAGRAVDALGRAMDGGGAVSGDAHVPLVGEVPRPLDRIDPREILPTGIRALDGILTLARGQRVGIFAASGVGKTTLMEQLAAQVECDRCVLCLVGERGREVESIWRKLAGREDANRFTVVAATSDESAALRARSVNYALCLADHWRAKGEHVLLVLDSVTRMAMALREIGLAAGAPPTVRAYTPNVFSALPRLVERCGALASGGSITAVMTVLSETDDVDDPIVELMKSLLDGHIVLSRSLAEQGHFPAIDIPRSVSRGAEKLVDADQAKAMREAVALLGAYEDARVMIESGVYKTGTNPAVDRAVSVRSDLLAFLRQGAGEKEAYAEAVRKLRAVTERGRLHA